MEEIVERIVLAPGLTCARPWWPSPRTRMRVAGQRARKCRTGADALGSVCPSGSCQDARSRRPGVRSRRRRCGWSGSGRCRASRFRRRGIARQLHIDQHQPSRITVHGRAGSPGARRLAASTDQSRCRAADRRRACRPSRFAAARDRWYPHTRTKCRLWRASPAAGQRIVERSGQPVDELQVSLSPSEVMRPPLNAAVIFLRPTAENVGGSKYRRPRRVWLARRGGRVGRQRISMPNQSFRFIRQPLERLRRA